MNFIFFSEYVTKSVYRKEKTFGTWLYDYWWLLLLAIITIGILIFLLYKHQTRTHTITLNIPYSPATTVTVRHNEVFNAPILTSNDKFHPTFKGWFRDTACMIPYNSSDKVTSDFPLYAKFE